MAHIKPYIHTQNQTQEPREQQQQQPSRFPVFFPCHLRSESQQQQNEQQQQDGDREEVMEGEHPQVNVPQCRGRVQLRKILRPLWPQQDFPPERETAVQAGPDPLLREEQNTAAPQQMERRVMRPLARQAGQELQQGINQICALKATQWRQAVEDGPPFLCNK